MGREAALKPITHQGRKTDLQKSLFQKVKKSINSSWKRETKTKSPDLRITRFWGSLVMARWSLFYSLVFGGSSRINVSLQ
ncbi:unnamed protein product [Caretta caretta]